MEDSYASSEEENFFKISEEGQSDHEDEVTGELDNPNQTQPSTPQISEDCQVVFQTVSESYKPGKPLWCFYTLSSKLVPSKKDYIAVFKEGWNSIHSDMIFQHAPYPKNWKANQESIQCMKFEKSDVPQKEDGESYQFCYIDSAGKIRGASKPFKFLETPMVDYTEVSEESFESLKDFYNSELVVKFTEERDNLSTEKALIEKINQLVGKVEELEATLSVNEEKDKEFTAKVEGQFASSEQQREELRVEIDNLKHLVMEVNKQNQIILANQGANKEEKQKVEQQLLVASSDQNHKQMLGGHGKDWKSVLCDIFSSFI